MATKVKCIGLGAAVALVSLSLFAAAGYGATARSTQSSNLNGAGSTFIQPLMSKWAGAFAKSNKSTHINYQGIGSGGGIQQFINKTVNYAATDAPMKPEEIAAAQKRGSVPVHVPMTIGSVVVSYNLPGVKKLRLDGQTLAKIFLGQITKWNNSAIVKLNKGTKLPSRSITVVHRSDSSGTSFTFTSYLNQISAPWHKQVGADKAPRWPKGVGGQGNAGVAAVIKRTAGAIGYNEIAYAVLNGLSYATLKNRSGRFIKPSLPSTTAAADGMKVPKSLTFSLVNSKNKNAYPIVGTTWVLAAKKQPNARTRDSLVRFLLFALTTGQKTAPSLLYAPLPRNIVQASLKAVKTIK